jgi:hypothetical protein
MLRATETTFAPSEAKAMARDLPKPLPEPVTITTFPDKRFMKK